MTRAEAICAHVVVRAGPPGAYRYALAVDSVLITRFGSQYAHADVETTFAGRSLSVELRYPSVDNEPVLAFDSRWLIGPNGGVDDIVSGRLHEGPW